MRTSIQFNINGQDFHLNNPDPELSLAFYLRQTVGLIGCKIGCEEGTCGSCTVVIAEYSHPRPIYKAINACLFPMYQADGKFIITVEGIGNKSKIHEIQKRLAHGHGTQCGFCSPGFVMSMYALLMETQWNPSIEQIHQAIKGNLCRCTGYRPIFEAFYTFAKDGCCKGQDPQLPREDVAFPLLDKTQNLIFPASLVEYIPKSGLLIESERVSVAVPSSIEEFDEILQQYREQNEKSIVKFVSSGIITRFAAFYKPTVREQWICTARIPEYRKVEVDHEYLTIGSGLSLRELYENVTAYCDPEISQAFRRMFRNYSSHQVFNAASWAGALCGKAVGDIEVLCRALDVDIHMKLTGQTVTLSSTSDYEELKKMISEGYLIEKMSLPRHLNGRMFAGKFGERPGPDTTVINYALVVSGSQIISDSRLIISDRTTVIKLTKLQSAMKDK
ncbi:unnamed protein product [Auanema sp. JU1783]|nr:unnamed protein product [Auanema sp. JU1783]